MVEVWSEGTEGDPKPQKFRLDILLLHDATQESRLPHQATHNITGHEVP